MRLEIELQTFMLFLFTSASATAYFTFISLRNYFRQDGLSGSLDATKGETGLFGGSIDGTVVYGEDKPPKAFSLIPDFMLKGYNLQQTEFSRPRRVAPKT